MENTLLYSNKIKLTLWNSSTNELLVYNRLGCWHDLQFILPKCEKKKPKKTKTITTQFLLSENNKLSSEF